MNNDAVMAPIVAQFWRFSVDNYGRDGVSPLLLDWQERLGVDVNMVLLCLWAADRGRALSAEEVAGAEAAAAGWQAASIAPLRALRRRLKGEWAGLSAAAEATRQAVLAAELEAERGAQGLMVEALAPWPEPVVAGDVPTLAQAALARAELAQANLLAYLGMARTREVAALLTRIG